MLVRALQPVAGSHRCRYGERCLAVVQPGHDSIDLPKAKPYDQLVKWSFRTDCCLAGPQVVEPRMTDALLFCNEGRNRRQASLVREVQLSQKLLAKVTSVGDWRRQPAFKCRMTSWCEG